MKENMKRKIAVLLTLLGVTSIVIGTTFAIYENTINTNKNHIIKTGVVNFTLTESTNGLVLDNLQELTDYEGMAQEEYYEFTIKNTGDTKTDYEISLVDKPNSSYTGTILNEKYIKVGLLKNNSKEIIVNLKDVNRLIDKVTLDVEDTVNYKLRLWLDFGNLEDEAKEALVGQKIFLALKINGIQNVNKVPTGADTLIKLTDNKDNSGLYTITHAKDSTLQIGTNEDITEYRYRGASPKNYVTFNNEVWRIIGVFPTDDGTGKIENRVKIIRNESIGDKPWDDGTTAYNYTKNDNLMLLQDNNKLKVEYLEKNDKYDVMLTVPDSSGCNGCKNNWTIATLKTRLNGEYYNNLTSEAKKMIGQAKYYLGGYNDSNLKKDIMYQYERKISGRDYYYGTNPNSWVGKLALMYVSDWGYATTDACTQTLGCKDNNWIHSGFFEWTLTQNTSCIGVFEIEYSSVGYRNLVDAYASIGVRPTLYLKSEIRIIDGDGTSTNPYIISSDGNIVLPVIEKLSFVDGYIYEFEYTAGTYPIVSYCRLNNDEDVNNCNWVDRETLSNIYACTKGLNINIIFIKDSKGNIASKRIEENVRNCAPV